MSDQPMTPLIEAMTEAFVQALARRESQRKRPTAEGAPPLLTEQEALRILGVRDSEGRAWIEAKGLKGDYPGSRCISLARLLAAGYPPGSAARNDDAEVAREAEAAPVRKPPQGFSADLGMLRHRG